jgi:hypothetical protein
MQNKRAGHDSSEHVCRGHGVPAKFGKGLAIIVHGCAALMSAA